MSSTAAPQVLQKRSADTALYDLDCSRLLATSETITSVTSITATPATSPALAFGTPSINAAPIVYDDHTAAIGKVVQVQISGGRSPPAPPRATTSSAA